MRSYYMVMMMALLSSHAGQAGYTFHRCCFTCAYNHSMIDGFPNNCDVPDKYTERKCAYQNDAQAICSEWWGKNSNGYSFAERRLTSITSNDCEAWTHYDHSDRYERRACYYCNSDLCNDHSWKEDPHTDGIYDNDEAYRDKMIYPEPYNPAGAATLLPQLALIFLCLWLAVHVMKAAVLLACLSVALACAYMTAVMLLNARVEHVLNRMPF